MWIGTKSSVSPIGAGGQASREDRLEYLHAGEVGDFQLRFGIGSAQFRAISVLVLPPSSDGTGDYSDFPGKVVSGTGLRLTRGTDSWSEAAALGSMRPASDFLSSLPTAFLGIASRR
jgi:hypothetical protein